MCFTWLDCKFFTTFLGNSAICQAFFTSSDQKRSSYDSPWMSCSIVKRISGLISVEDGWYYTWWESVCPPLIPKDFSLHCTLTSLNNTKHTIKYKWSRVNQPIDWLIIQPIDVSITCFLFLKKNHGYCLIELHQLTCLTCWCERSIKHWNISMS